MVSPIDITRGRRGILVGSAIIFLGLVLRLIHLTEEDLWYDEIATTYLISNSLYEIAVELPTTDPHPPLYYIIAKLWTDLVGTSPFTLRIISVAFTVAALPVIYGIATRLFNRRTGLIALLFSALSPFYITYAHDARMYPLLLFCAALSCYAFVRVAQDGRRLDMALYVLATVALAYSHVFGAFIILAQNIFVGIYLLAPRYRTLWIPLKRWVTLQGVAGVLCLPWIYLLALRATSGGGPDWITRPTAYDFINTATHYISGAGNTEVWLALSFFGLVTALAFVDTRAIWHRDLDPARVLSPLINRPAVVYLGFIVGVQIALAFVLSYVATPIYVIRYTIAGSFAFYILLARGVSSIDTRHLRLAVLLIAVIGLAAPLASYYQEDQNEQWSDAIGDIEASATNDDAVLLAGSNTNRAFSYHVPDGFGPAVMVVGQSTSQEAILNATSEGEDIYIFSSHSDSDHVEALRSTVEAETNRSLSEERSYIGIDIYVYEPES